MKLLLIEVLATFGFVNGKITLEGNPIESSRELVFNGFDVSDPVNKYPWFVSVRESRDDPFQHICGGSLIHPEWVLTADHCISFSSIATYQVWLRFGNLDTPAAGKIERDVLEIIRGPPYLELPFVNHANDVALMRIAPVSIPGKRIALDRESEFAQVGFTMDLIGHGAKFTPNGPPSPVLQYSNLTRVQTTANCNSLLQARYQTHSVPISDRSTVVEDMMICCMESDASGFYNDQGACQGDSGGPLFNRNHEFNEDMLAGVVSWGISCHTDVPSVYARVSTFVDWIESHTGPLLRAGCTKVGWAGRDGLYGVELEDPIGTGKDFYGTRVAVFEDTAVVAASARVHNNVKSGVVYVFENVPEIGWTKTADLIPSDAALDLKFGITVGMIDRDTVVVGSEGNGRLGQIHVFRRSESDGQTWTETDIIRDPNGDGFDNFGSVLAVDKASSARIVIGSPSDDFGDKLAAGSAHIYTFDGTGFTLEQKITGTKYNENLGKSIAISEDLLGFGFKGFNEFGHVDLYKKVGGVWRKTTNCTLATGDFTRDVTFGESLAIANNMIAIAAPKKNTVYIYEVDATGSTCQQIQTITGPSGEFGEIDDYFASSLAMENNTLLIGSHSEDTVCSNGGAIYVYKYDGSSSWTFDSLIHPQIHRPSIKFAMSSIDISGEAVIAGAPGIFQKTSAAFIVSELPENATFTVTPSTGERITEFGSIVLFMLLSFIFNFNL